MKLVRLLLLTLTCSLLWSAPAFAQGTWDTGKAAMPLSRNGAAAGVLNEVLYVHGGQTGTSTLSNALSIYDGMSNTWTTGPTTAVSRSSHAAAALNGKLY